MINILSKIHREGYVKLNALAQYLKEINTKSLLTKLTITQPLIKCINILNRVGDG